MDHHDIYEQCFELYQFIGSFDLEAYNHPIEDRKVVNGEYFYCTYSRDAYRVIRQQADELLALAEFPAKAIADVANRYFPDLRQCKPWFEEMLALLKERVDRENS